MSMQKENTADSASKKTAGSGVVSVFSGDNPVIAVYKGREIKLSDLNNQQFSGVMNQFYEFLTNSVKSNIIQSEAQTPEFQAGINGIQSTEAEAKEFYDRESLQERGSFDDLKANIIQYLDQQKQRDYANQMLTDAVNKGDLVFRINKPAELAVTTGVSDAIKTRPAQGQVAIVEYSDYQCPFCKSVQKTLKELKAEFPQVSFYYKHFPLNFHTEADEAAIASECANREGKFEAYHDILFNNQSAQFPDNLMQYAQDAGITDMNRFKSCYAEDGLREKVNRHIAEGAEIGINGTPGFVIGIYNAEQQSVTGLMLMPGKGFSDGHNPGKNLFVPTPKERSGKQQDAFSDGVSVRAPHKRSAAAGNQPVYTVTAYVSVPAGKHIYSVSRQTGVVGTQIRFADPGVKPVGTLQESPAETIYDDTLKKNIKAHRREFQLTGQFTAEMPLPEAVKMSLYFQICDQKICSLPAEKPFMSVRTP
ncbi:hypothetical protein CHS0354_035241 [Potamilus streckersoni]|uniref:Thioredoxin domain-containing protein n=1 Tax=Potamilus streckersoni TaxID=2493646 RepID=A0AAE0VNJ2_9BIVA|nr:hypothetical protein CHS0354_035241 [Potamilus streckersoni]